MDNYRIADMQSLVGYYAAIVERGGSDHLVSFSPNPDDPRQFMLLFSSEEVLKTSLLSLGYPNIEEVRAKRLSSVVTVVAMMTDAKKRHMGILLDVSKQEDGRVLGQMLQEVTEAVANN